MRIQLSPFFAVVFRAAVFVFFMSTVALTTVAVGDEPECENCGMMGGGMMKIMEKITACAQCHGVGGNAPIADYPKIAGQHADYLRQALRAYRDGGRDNAIMGAQARELSDADIDHLSFHFSKQRGDLR